MIRYIIRRILGGILVIFAASIITFLIFQVGPAVAHVSPAQYYVGKIPPTEQGLKLVEHKFGFDLPIWKQYLNWLGGIFAGRDLDNGSGTAVHCSAPCLGYSFRLQLPVTQMIKDALPIDLSLAFGAAILWLLGGVIVGVISALKKGSFFDRFGMTLALAGVSLPIFFTGPHPQACLPIQAGLVARPAL